ncbi:unnamed protein product [Brassica oleracea]|uniref:(rape) hypothetical protein n=1 Tax=Brassica napus TaxID=3708 RepID=A0A816KCI5_BRANA|nr:unnamed protein product [Brassica napus]
MPQLFSALCSRLIKMTILCGFITILVLRGTISVGNLGSSSTDAVNQNIMLMAHHPIYTETLSMGGGLSHGFGQQSVPFAHQQRIFTCRAAARRNSSKDEKPSKITSDPTLT